MNPAIEYITKIASGTALCVAGVACQSWLVYVGILLIVEPVAASYIAVFKSHE